MAVSEPLLNEQQAAEVLREVERLVLADDEPNRSFRRLTDLLVPQLADWATIRFMSQDGEFDFRLTSHRDEGDKELARTAESLKARLLPDAVERQLQEGHLFATDDLVSLVAPALEMNQLAKQVFMEIQPRATVIAPLPVRGEIPGLLVVSMAGSERRYNSADIELINKIAQTLTPFVEGAMLQMQIERARSSRDRSTVLLDAVFSSSPLGLAFVDTDMHLHRANDTFFAINENRLKLGASLQHVDTELIHQIRPMIKRVLDGHDALIEVQVEVNDELPASGLSQYSAHIYGVKTEDGTLAGAGVALLDLTARVEAEMARSRLDSQLRIALNAARMGLIRRKHATGAVEWSSTAALLLGLDPLEPSSEQALLSVVHSEDRIAVRKAIEHCAQYNDSFESQFRVIHSDGSLRWILLKAQCNTDVDNSEVIGVLLDITEQKERTDEQSRLALLQAKAGEQAVRMQRVSAALARSITVAQVCDVLATEGSAALGAPLSQVLLLDDWARSLEVVRTHENTAGSAAVPDYRSVSLSSPSPAAEVARTGDPIFITSLEDLHTRYPSAGPSLENAGIKSTALVCLQTPGNVHGVWSMSWVSEREFDDAELIVLLALAAQGSQAIERAKLFERERLISIALQRTLLPAELPDLNDAQVTRRYVPGSSNIEVGGDWYDVISLSPTRVALVIGDVSGHNVDSAAVMGQVRNAVRSYAWEGHQAGRVIEATNKLICGLEPGVLITTCFIELNLEDGIASVAVAGHPPPIIRRAEGTIEVMEISPDPPIGTDADATYSQSSLFLNPGDSLVLYTDGIVETRETPLGAGLEYLQRAVDAAGDVGPDELADFLLESLNVSEREDDVALLILRYEPDRIAKSVHHRVVRRHLVSTPASAGVARRFSSDVLDDWGVTELTDQVTLCVSELVTNALIHTATDFELVLRLNRNAVRIEIVDQSERVPVIRDESHEGDTTGRGLQIVSAIADSWGIDSVGTGKAVWFELVRPR